MIENMIPYVYDVFVVLVLSHNVFYCYKKGFLMSLISMISYIIGFLASHLFGKFILRGLFTGSFFPILEESFLKNLDIGGGDFLQNKFGMGILKSFTNKTVFVIIFFCLLSFFRVVKRYIFKLTRLFKKMPVIGMLDGVLGGICGIFKSFLFLFLFAIICFILITLTQDNLSFLNTKIIKSTHLFFLFYKITFFSK